MGSHGERVGISGIPCTRGRRPSGSIYGDCRKSELQDDKPPLIRYRLSLVLISDRSFSKEKKGKKETNATTQYHSSDFREALGPCGPQYCDTGVSRCVEISGFEPSMDFVGGNPNMEKLENMDILFKQSALSPVLHSGGVPVRPVGVGSPYPHIYTVSSIPGRFLSSLLQLCALLFKACPSCKMVFISSSFLYAGK